MRYISSRSSVLQKVMRYFCYTKRQKRERRSTLKLNTRYLVCFYVSFSIYLLQWTGSIDIGHSERQRGNAVIVCEHVAHAVMYNWLLRFILLQTFRMDTDGVSLLTSGGLWCTNRQEVQRSTFKRSGWTVTGIAGKGWKWSYISIPTSTDIRPVENPLL
jgi:hypothetical protein